MTSCSYLEHTDGKGEIAPQMAKVEAVRTFQQPVTKKSVRAFLGLSGYYRSFIPAFSATAAVFTDLTRKTAPAKMEWTIDCQQAFQKLKDSLTSVPVLSTPDDCNDFILQTDASDRGIGAVLSQQDEYGSDNPIAYFSKKLLTGRPATPQLRRNA